MKFFILFILFILWKIIVEYIMINYKKWSISIRIVKIFNMIKIFNRNQLLNMIIFEILMILKINYKV